jgi:hypothetical protein
MFLTETLFVPIFGGFGVKALGISRKTAFNGVYVRFFPP